MPDKSTATRWDKISSNQCGNYWECGHLALRGGRKRIDAADSNTVKKIDCRHAPVVLRAGNA
jgi:hypothetical protein